MCFALCVCVGILYEDGSINNALSIERLAEVAVAYAKAGITQLNISQWRFIARRSIVKVATL